LLWLRSTIAPPVDFSERLSTADHIIVTNDLQAGLAYTATGEEVARLVKAVTMAKEDVRWRTQAIFNWNIQFYAGTNRLGDIHLQSEVFMIGDKEYTDYSGVLKAFWQKLETKRKEAPPNN